MVWWHSGVPAGQYQHYSTIKARPFVVRDFVIGTSNALVATVRVEDTDVKVGCLLSVSDLYDLLQLYLSTVFSNLNIFVQLSSVLCNGLVFFELPL